MPHNRPQRKKGPQSPQRFVWQTNLRLQSKVLSPRPYPTYWAMGGTCDREELAWVTLGKSCRLGDGQYNHPLPWSGPMLFKSSRQRVSLKYSLRGPPIHDQIHPNRQKHVKHAKTRHKKHVIIVQVRHVLYRRCPRTIGPGICFQAKLINSIHIRR